MLFLQNVSNLSLLFPLHLPEYSIFFIKFALRKGLDKLIHTNM